MKKLSLILFAVFFSALAHPSFAQEIEVEPFLEKSRELRDEKKYTEAAVEIGKAIAILPGNAKLYLQRAHLYELAQNSKGVSEDVSKAVELDPFNKENILEGTWMLLNLGQCEQVLNIINAYILKNPKSDEAFERRMQTKTCLDDLEGAYEDISTAIELNPKNPLHRTNQANILARLGDSEKSLELLKKLINNLEDIVAKAKSGAEQKMLKHQLALTYATRSRVFEKNKDSSSAVADLSRAFELTQSLEYIRQRAQVYRRASLLQPAIMDYTEVIRLSKNNLSVLYLERGDIFIEAKKYDKALQDYEQALKLESELKDVLERRIKYVREKLEDNQPTPKQ